MVGLDAAGGQEQVVLAGLGGAGRGGPPAPVFVGCSPQISKGRGQLWGTPPWALPPTSYPFREGPTSTTGLMEGTTS